jgi:hypothetical protein
MSDVLAQLMRWMENSDIDDADVVLRDAITEIAGLRARLDERRRMPTLTDAEREAIEKAISRELDCDWYGGPEPARVVTLRGMLERTK